MGVNINPLAGQPARPDMLVDVLKLVTAYFTGIPDPACAAERVAFGTSGHRGSSFERSFNERHILAIAQAICLYREKHGIGGPLFLGMDTHALSVPALSSALEVLAANDMDVILPASSDYTPTPAISRAILTYNRGRDRGHADGIVITPSHNPPESGGFKYNPPHGGPAESEITIWIEATANTLLEQQLAGVKRMPFERARRAPGTHRQDILHAYVSDLEAVLDMDAIRTSGIRIGVDPLGGAGVHYWEPIAERYGLDLTVVNTTVDPTFRFMTIDWDGRIRMDPSSPYAMRSLIGLRDRFEITLACDTDHDRHGVITGGAGLLPPNHYLSAAAFYLFQNRPDWDAAAALGKTAVSSQMFDRVAAKLGRALHELPVGFKWFVAGLQDRSLGLGVEESAGASFLRRDGSTWTTDKDGIVAALLAAEMTARLGRDPGELYRSLEEQFGTFVYDRVEFPVTQQQKAALSRLSSKDIHSTALAGEKIESIQTAAPGNGAPLGGVKVTAKGGWFAVRPSGTEDICKIYGESDRGQEHLGQILAEAQAIVSAALAKDTP
jgi:phosphoglucomutase